jgi:hypothetical protein
MDGWVYLPRYIDKIRLHLAGKLHPEYHENFGKNSDALWLKAAGVSHEQMIEVVRGTLTDGEVCDWVRTHIKKTPAEKEMHRRMIVHFPTPGNAEEEAFFEKRKAAYGLGHRADIKTRADMLDADEGRV